MHWIHQPSQFFHFLDAVPYFRILANETGARFTTTHGIHHSKPRTISQDHITHGTIGMLSKLPEADGTSALTAAKHSNLDLQHANTN